MHRFEFKPDDLFINRLKTYPEYNVFMYQARMYINRDSSISGSGGLCVYDINRNRATGLITPFVVSSSAKSAFKSQQYQPLVQNHSGDFQWISAYVRGVQTSVTASTTDYGSLSTTRGENSENHIFSSYGYESPIKRNLTEPISGYNANYFDVTSVTTAAAFVRFITPSNLTASALQNVARKYTTLSDHFIFTSSSIRSRDLVYDNNSINFIFIPSMYYGSTIKKGSVELNYYITGSKIATCADTNHNGTLIGTTGSTSGSVVGLVLYDEGIIMLTSSSPIAPSDNNGIIYDGVSALTSSWLYYGTTLNDGTGSSNTLASASYDLNFKGTNYINTMTMFAHAKKGHLNHSNNPTYKDLTFTRPSITGSGTSFSEGGSTIANVVSASYVSASFEKITYISKVHIYDEDGNLIAITSMAKPVKKTLTDEFTFKMKFDL
tara:strand:- start:73 stop:1380 length:1308 start_codon:yes stop_codon:yes gene_type:complete